MMRPLASLCCLVLLVGCGGGGPTPGKFSFNESFPADGASWPSRWQQLGGVASATALGGRGRLAPVASGYSLARMGSAFSQRDAEVTFQLAFEDVGTQGVGLYLRQSGGYLRATSQHGGGYAVFVEGFSGSQIGVWREVDGEEHQIQAFDLPAPLSSNTIYAVRFRVAQAGSTTTRLQARLWAAAQAEPSTWQVDATDLTPSLQGVSGGIAVDSYSSVASGTITAGTLVGNIAVAGL